MIGERVELDLVKPGKEDVPPGGFLADGAIVFVSGGGARTSVGASRRKLSALPTAGGKLVFTCVARFPNTKHSWGR